MPEGYSLGPRQGTSFTYGQNKKMTENRLGWATLEKLRVLVIGGENNHESGGDLVLYIPRPGKIPDVSISLTDMTEQELEALKTLFNTAFDLALPVVKLRDKEAEDAWAQGDDSFVRSYRPVPQLVFREEQVRKYRESLHGGPSGVPEGDGGQRDHDGGVRGLGDGVVEHDSPAGRSEDDGTEAH